MTASIKSALWMLFASINFALLNTQVKFLSSEFHITQIIFFRSLFAVIFIFPWIIKDGFSSLKTNSVKLQMIRSIIALGAMYMWFFSIANIPLAKATAINFTAPVFGAIFAIIFLKEKIKKRRAIAIMISFIGALTIIRPGFVEINLFILFAIMASVLMGMAAIFIKKLSMLDHPNSVVFYMPAFIALVSLFPSFYFWRHPSIFELILLISTGLSATLAHQAITRAFAISEATYVLVFDYLRLPFTVILSFYIFYETTSFWIWIGGFIIFFSSTYIISREKKAGKIQTPSILAKKHIN